MLQLEKGCVQDDSHGGRIVIQSACTGHPNVKIVNDFTKGNEKVT